MTEYERTMDDECFINVYKSINGFKPRGHEFFTASEARRDEIWKMIDEENRQHFEDSVKADCESVNDFEKLIQETIELGAESRENALEWIIDGHFDEYDKMYVEGDPGYFNFEFNLPYGYDWRNGKFYTGSFNPFTGKAAE